MTNLTTAIGCAIVIGRSNIMLICIRPYCPCMRILVALKGIVISYCVIGRGALVRLNVSPIGSGVSSNMNLGICRCAGNE